MKEVSKEECVITRLTTRGTGTPESPFRKVTEVWNSKAEKIAEFDPCAPIYDYCTGTFSNVDKPQVSCTCEHEFVSAVNEVIKSGEVCLKCGAVRP